MPSITDGEFLIRNLWLSCDPAQRPSMEVDTYIPKLPLGGVMLSGSAGEVVESKHPDFAAGELALLIAYVAVRQGVEAWRGDACCA